MVWVKKCRTKWKQMWRHSWDSLTFNPILMLWPSRRRRGGREGHIHVVCHGVSWLYHLFSHCQALNPAANWRLPADSLNNAHSCPLMLLHKSKWSKMQMNVTVLFPDDGNITGFIHIEYERPGKSSLAASGVNYPETLRNLCMWPHTSAITRKSLEF